MSDLRFDITPFLDQDEGQHFDRKSLYEGAMEVVSPGGLVGNLTTEALLTLKRVHHSRNPLRPLQGE